jgi:REP element-mobilizing transposase RayT
MNLSLSIAYHIMLKAQDNGAEIDLNNNDLIRHVSELLEKNDCHIYAIGGRGKRLNMLISLNPKVALHDLLEKIMNSTEMMMKKEIPVNGFKSWDRDYWAYTHSTNFMDHIIDFIKADDEEYQEERRAREAYLYDMRKRGGDIDDDPFFDELYYMDP